MENAPHEGVRGVFSDVRFTRSGVVDLATIDGPPNESDSFFRRDRGV